MGNYLIIERTILLQHILQLKRLNIETVGHPTLKCREVSIRKPMAPSPEKGYFHLRSFISNKVSCLSKMPEVIKGLVIPSGHSLILQKAARSCTFPKEGDPERNSLFPKYDEDDTTIQTDLGRMVV